MTTVNLGPFAFPTPLFICLVAFAVMLLGGWIADRKLGTHAESAIWTTLLVGLVAGRLTFVLQYFDAYAHRPLSMLDIRDGGFSAGAAVVAAAFVLAWYMLRNANLRKPLLVSVAAGISALGMAYASLNLLGPPKAVVDDVTMATLTGDSMAISDFHGKPTVINLWASWCPPCRREMPALQEGQNLNPDIHFVFANQGEEAAIVDAYLTQEGLVLDNVLLDKLGKLASGTQSRGLPTTLFLDAQGRLVDIRLGELSSATLRARLNALRSSTALMRPFKD